MEVSNAPAYYKMATIAVAKSYIAQALGGPEC